MLYTKEQMKKLQEKALREEIELKANLEKEFGLQNHPKRDLLWDMAREHGHSSGSHEVAQYYKDFARLLK